MVGLVHCALVVDIAGHFRNNTAHCDMVVVHPIRVFSNIRLVLDFDKGVDSVISIIGVKFDKNLKNEAY